MPATDLRTEEEPTLNPPPSAASPAPGVTRDEVRHVAALASLELTAAEEERMERDLNAILGYVAELNELDTANVEPLAQVSEILSNPALGTSPSGQALRADQPLPSLARATIMADAPATDGVFFKVPKVIER
jgi:aspartyl-tRNA(Asn)/glutamyl-tRNA(Gln) amidotransferase subunit C